MIKYSLTVILTLLSICSFAQSSLKLPLTNPRVTLTYTIGVTDITIKYGAPGVKNREIWGELVPFGEIWSAGANEATTLQFSTDVRIAQDNVSAGTYSFFILPLDSANWNIILSKQKGLWGTEGYDSTQEVVRIPFSTQAVAFHETLEYSIKDISPNSGRLTLTWANRQVSVPIRVETHKETMELIKDTLSNAKLTDWTVYAQAVNYLLQQNMEHELALEWINKSIRIEENFYNTWLKAKLLAQKREYTEAFELNKKAQRLGKKAKDNYDVFASEIEDAAILWKERRFSLN